MEAEAGKREVTRDRRPLCVITRPGPYYLIGLKCRPTLSHSLSPFPISSPAVSLSLFCSALFPFSPQLAQSSLMQHACSAPKKAGRSKSGVAKKGAGEGLASRGILKYLSEKMIFPHLAISAVRGSVFERSGNIFSFGRPARGPSPFSRSLSRDEALGVRSCMEKSSRGRRDSRFTYDSLRPPRKWKFFVEKKGATIWQGGGRSERNFVSRTFKIPEPANNGRD